MTSSLWQVSDRWLFSFTLEHKLWIGFEVPVVRRCGSSFFVPMSACPWVARCRLLRWPGSRDGKLALWRVCSDDCKCLYGGHQAPTSVAVRRAGESRITTQVTGRVWNASQGAMDRSADGAVDLRPYRYGRPVEARLCPTADKVRALAYNEREVVSVAPIRQNK